MLFHSQEFLFFFLPVTLAGFFLLSFLKRPVTILGWLTLSSLFYYGWWNPRYLLLIFASIAVNFTVGRLLEFYRKTDQAKAGKYLLALGIAANLVALGTFKYIDFFIRNLNFFANATLPESNFVLPLAISFFTFQQIAYLVDVHRGLAEEHNPLEYVLFISFFPQLIAGPIVHHREMMPQFRHGKGLVVSASNIADGMTIFLLGLFKKLVLADSFATYADPVFKAAHEGHVLTFFAAWGGALSYTFQLYFDFSAYSDMAIGLALMFGIRLPINFDAPYRATNIIEFWRRWHMTLSRFLKDYLYIPLGGNRQGKLRRNINIMITMLLGGLWHGASWTFVAWGALHGFYLVLNHLWRRMRPNTDQYSFGRFGQTLGWSITFIAVVVGWVLFRAESFMAAIAVLKGMVGMNGAALPIQMINTAPWLSAIAKGQATVPFLAGGTVISFILLTGLLMLSFAIVLLGRPQHRLSQRARLILLVPTVAFVIQAVLYGAKTQEFLYFQF